MPETVIGNAAMMKYTGEGFDCRGELVIVLNGQTVSADVVARMADSERDIWAVGECKLTMCEELVAQCSRWIGIAHSVTAFVVEPQHRTSRHQVLCEVCQSKGIGIAYVDEAGLANVVLEPRFNPHARPHKLEAAWSVRAHSMMAQIRDVPPSSSDSPRAMLEEERALIEEKRRSVVIMTDRPARLTMTEAIRQTSTVVIHKTQNVGKTDSFIGELGKAIEANGGKVKWTPPHQLAGSRGGPAEKRAKNMWDPATEWLSGLMGPGGLQWASWMEIRRGCGLMNVTPDKARKAWERRQWVGVDMQIVGGKAQFKAKESGNV